jgi:hypothetical protein
LKDWTKTYSRLKKKLQTSKLLYLKIIPVIFFLLLTEILFAPSVNIFYIYVSEPVCPYDRLIKAVVQVESMGNTLAFNISEEAIGAFQIRPIRLLDFNQRTGKNYVTEDCFNFNISREIFLYYAEKISFTDYEKIAREWNGSGIATLDYWGKVKSFL